MKWGSKVAGSPEGAGHLGSSAAAPGSGRLRARRHGSAADRGCRGHRVNGISGPLGQLGPVLMLTLGLVAALLPGRGPDPGFWKPTPSPLVDPGLVPDGSLLTARFSSTCCFLSSFKLLFACCTFFSLRIHTPSPPVSRLVVPPDVPGVPASRHGLGGRRLVTGQSSGLKCNERTDRHSLIRP